MDRRFAKLAEGPILLALESPRYAPAALHIMRTLSRLLNRSVILIHAAAPPRSSEAILQRLDLSEQEAINIAVTSLTGDPAGEILKFARERQSCLLVIGKAPARKDLSHVSEHLLSEAPCPVLLVPPAIREGWGDHGTILLPLDGTPSTAAAVPWATEFAVRMGATIEILYVGGASSAGEPGSMSLPSFIDQPQYEWPMWKREFLSRFCDAYWEGTPPVDVRLSLHVGSPSETILRSANDHGPDLIVLGWHGDLRKPHAQTLRNILLQSHWPVVTVRL